MKIGYLHADFLSKPQCQSWPASLGLLATPVVSVVIATLWLGEALSLSLVSAIVLILGGVAIGATGHGNPPMPAAG